MIARMISWALVVAGTVPTVGFVVGFWRYSAGAWRRDVMGRHLMATMAALAVTFVINTAAIVVSLLVGVPATTTWFVWPYLVAFACVDYTLWRRWWLLRHPPDGSEKADPGISRDAHRP